MSFQIISFKSSISFKLLISLNSRRGLVNLGKNLIRRPQAAAGALAAVLSAAAASNCTPSTIDPALNKQGQQGQEQGASTAAVDREKVLEQQRRNKEREEKRKDEEAKEAVRRQIAADKLVSDHQ